MLVLLHVHETDVILHNLPKGSFIAHVQRTYCISLYIIVESGGADNEDTINEVPEFPKSIHELYKCCTRAFRYGSELTSDHPVSGNQYHNSQLYAH